METLETVVSWYLPCKPASDKQHNERTFSSLRQNSPQKQREAERVGRVLAWSLVVGQAWTGDKGVSGSGHLAPQPGSREKSPFYSAGVPS